MISMNKEDTSTLIGLVVSLIGVSVLVVGSITNETIIFTLLGAMVIIIGVIYVVTSKRLRTRPWRDWFPF